MGWTFSTLYIKNNIMAKELRFNLDGKEFLSSPEKLERKKIYGWSELVATDKDGVVCEKAYLSTDDALIIPSGALKQAVVDADGRWLDKSELVPYDEDGNKLETLPSSFDLVIELKETVDDETFLDNDWESVYQLSNPELAEAVGDKIFKFEFNYRASTNHNDAYLLNTPGGLFLFAGDKQEFPMVSFEDVTTIDEVEEVEEEIDDLDFSMF